MSVNKIDNFVQSCFQFAFHLNFKLSCEITIQLIIFISLEFQVKLSFQVKPQFNESCVNMSSIQA